MCVFTLVLRLSEIYEQIDIAPTFAVLLGLPIPASSIGSLIPEMLAVLDDDEQLFALHYNGLRLMENLRMQSGRDSFLTDKGFSNNQSQYVVLVLMSCSNVPQSFTFNSTKPYVCTQNVCKICTVPIIRPKPTLDSNASECCTFHRRARSAMNWPRNSSTTTYSHWALVCFMRCLYVFLGFNM